MSNSVTNRIDLEVTTSVWYEEGNGEYDGWWYSVVVVHRQPSESGPLGSFEINEELFGWGQCESREDALSSAASDLTDLFNGG